MYRRVTFPFFLDKKLQTKFQSAWESQSAVHTIQVTLFYCWRRWGYLRVCLIYFITRWEISGGFDWPYRPKCLEFLHLCCQSGGRGLTWPGPKLVHHLGSQKKQPKFKQVENIQVFPIMVSRMCFTVFFFFTSDSTRLVKTVIFTAFKLQILQWNRRQGLLQPTKVRFLVLRLWTTVKEQNLWQQQR